MNYPEQLKRMSNEELLEKFAQYHSRASWDSYRLRMSKTELLRRIELKDETLKQQYQKGWESRGEEAMKRVKTRPIKNKPEVNEDFVNVTGELQPPPITVIKGEAEPRLLNQLRIHWKWLKEQPYEEVAKYCTSILIERGYKEQPSQEHLKEALERILSITESTDEISPSFNTEEAINCDIALNEICKIAKEALNQKQTL